MSHSSAALKLRIGRVMKLRDLHTLLLVAELGSMAKAAARLSVTQPAISQSIAELEAFAGVRLLDRGPRGITLTEAGAALVSRGSVAFDTLQLAMQDLAFQTTPGIGNVGIAADMSFIASGLLADIILHLTSRHPLIRVHVLETTTRTEAPDFLELRERQVDVMLGRPPSRTLERELLAEILRDEPILVVAGEQHRLVRETSVTFEQLAVERWILATADNRARAIVEDAFRARSLVLPEPEVTTYSMPLRKQLLASGRYLTVMPEAAFHHAALRWQLRALPVSFEPRLLVAAVTLKHRSLSRAAELLLDSVRAVFGGMQSSRLNGGEAPLV